MVRPVIVICADRFEGYWKTNSRVKLVDDTVATVDSFARSGAPREAEGIALASFILERYSRGLRVRS